MSFENAKSNLKEFGKELGLEGIEFDENNTCILGIDDEFSLHLTYEPNSKRLYLYSPLLDGLPKDDKTKLKLYERLLEGSMLGGQMAGGGVGVAVKEELKKGILYEILLEDFNVTHDFNFIWRKNSGFNDYYMKIYKSLKNDEIDW